MDFFCRSSERLQKIKEKKRKKADNQGLVKTILKDFQALETRISIKIHFVFIHLDRFFENHSDISKGFFHLEKKKKPHEKNSSNKCLR